MKIKKIKLQNFRYFESIEIDFLERFNVIIGNNGTGKSTLMEGLCIAASSFFLGIDGIEYRKFESNDHRYVNFNNHPEYQYPMSITASGQIGKNIVNWSVQKTGKSKFTKENSFPIKNISRRLAEQVRAGEHVNLPVIVYFGSNRLWNSSKVEDLNKPEIIANESRLNAYKDAIRPTVNYQYLKKWFISKELASLQKKEDLPEIIVVRKAISSCVENCKNVYYSLETNALVMEMQDERVIRWNNLSDGQRNILAVVADIAYRCINLNPHMKEKALESEGIVLIDEIDVHLHPGWQKNILRKLKNVFPNIQFIVSTHSPLILHSLELGDRIISLENQQPFYFDNMFGRDIDDTLLQLMDTPTDNSKIKEYLGLIEAGKGKSDSARILREEIESIVGADYKELSKADALIYFYEKK